METDRFQIALTFLFDRLPTIDSQQFSKIINDIEPVSTDIVVDVQMELPNFLRASIEFDSHRLHLTGFSVPVPKYWLDLTADFSELTPADKSAIDSHKAYIICSYEGNCALAREKLIALYKTAYGFKDMGLLCVLDRDIWACRTLKMLSDIVDYKKLEFFRESTPIDLTTNLVKLSKDNGDIWFCTKGFHRFKSSNFAYLGSHLDAEFICHIFSALFDVLHENELTLDSEHVILFEDGMSMVIDDIYECIDFLNSPLGTFVLTKAPSTINI